VITVVHCCFSSLTTSWQTESQLARGIFAPIKFYIESSNGPLQTIHVNTILISAQGYKRLVPLL
jgi:hypothetical protein